MGPKVRGSTKQKLVKADPIIAIRVALNPVVRRSNGKEELLGEIAAKLFEVPQSWGYLTVITTQFHGLAKHPAVVVARPGPTFNMVP